MRSVTLVRGVLSSESAGEGPDEVAGDMDGVVPADARLGARCALALAIVEGCSLWFARL